MTERSTAVRCLFDLHHLGLRHTGNETWGRSMCSALSGRLRPDDQLDVAITKQGRARLPQLPNGRVWEVSNSSLRRLLVDLPRIVRRSGPDVLVVQHTAPLTRVPSVVAIHDLSFMDPRANEWLSRTTRLRYRATIQDSARRAAHVLALSEHTRRDLLKYFDLPDDKVSVAHAAVDPEFSGLLVGRPRTAGPADSFDVLCVGNVLPRKNVGVLAEAVRLLIATGVPARLHVVGQVPAAGTAIAQQLVRVLGDAVTFHGYLDDAALAGWYVKAHVMAFPSLYEGFGIPVLEAMLAGTPTVVSDASCLPEVAGDASLVVPARDPMAWKVALERIATDSTLSESLTCAGRKRALSFSWDDSATTLDAVIRRIAS